MQSPMRVVQSPLKPMHCPMRSVQMQSPMKAIQMVKARPYMPSPVKNQMYRPQPYMPSPMRHQPQTCEALPQEIENKVEPPQVDPDVRLGAGGKCVLASVE
eukprot:Blabericola_migrator_1__2005@NODE_1547_length_4305_cov_162_802029_g1014_i0_p4_GENE_NODE_1547_length_4305_cov_162_802029_g1014_i0NODE_1547_length_4305_cov_162_802029_g1014_i0_p4_ORF_typecomplete_len112_score14_46_NODE_1547_length_4305_cov_162_802029_g1014_i035337